MLIVPQLKIKKKYKSIAVLTSGGDAPGMNAAIRAVVRYGIAKNCQVFGVMKGFSGLISHDLEKMSLGSVANILQRGGTILKTSRCQPFFKKSVRREACQFLRSSGIEGLIIIGGDGSFAGGHLMGKENDYPVIGIPGTIDNDVWGTENTIGFDSAVNTAIHSIDQIRDTASSHDRLFLVEVMGRSSGAIALQVGIGGGAETVVIPEENQSLSEICKRIERGVKRGKTSSIIVVAEGGPQGKANLLAKALSKKGYNPRVCILGHTQRGGSPTAYDRFLASSLGASAVAYLLAGYRDTMVGVRDDAIALTPLGKVFGKHRQLPKGLFELADILAT